MREGEEKKDELKCSWCGRKLESGMKECPGCSATVEFEEEPFEEGYGCPKCGREFEEPVPVCPDCGTEFEGIEELADWEMECPDCGYIFDPDDTICPSCGYLVQKKEVLEAEAPEIEEEEPEEVEAVPISLDYRGIEEEELEREEIESVVEEEEIRPPPLGIEAVKPIETRLAFGVTNGLRMKEEGRINGLTNGLTNGLRAIRIGITNGVTNGNGITNGLGARKRLFEGRKNNFSLIIIPAIILILVLAPYITVNISEPPEEIEIDGNFGDWSEVIIISDTGEGFQFNQNADIVDYGVDGRLSELSFYVEVEGDMLDGEPETRGRHVDTAYIFIDKDQTHLSGYLIKGIGADYMIQVEGWQGEIFSQDLYEFTSNDQDWNLWEGIGKVPAAIKDSELEVQVDYGDLDLKNHDTVDVLFYMQSWDKFEDFSDTVISNEEGILLVNQQGIGDSYISGNANSLLKLDLSAVNSDIIIEKMAFTRIGKGDDDDVSVVRLIEGTREIAIGSLSMDYVELVPETGISLQDGDSKTLYVAIDLDPNAQAQNSIGFKISRPRDITTDNGTVTLKTISPYQNRYDVSYINSVPQEIKVDGAFADWVDKDLMIDNTGETDYKNLDITEYGISNNSEMVSFYLRVDGEIGLGTHVPYWNDAEASFPAEPSEPGPPPPPKPPAPKPEPITGEDLAYIYIDSDNISTTGYSIGDIGADHRIEIKGRYGEIVSSKVLSFFGSSPLDSKWLEMHSVEAGKDTSRLETQIMKDDLGIAGQFRIYFQTTDWSESEFDYSDEGITRHSRHTSTSDSTYPASLPRGTRNWPSTWISVTTDANDTVSDESNDILELYYYEEGDFIYFRIRVDVNTAPNLDDNSWGVYIDDGSDGNNDFLIQENWTDEVGYWGWSGSDWDWSQNELTIDIVRTTTMDVGGTTYGVIDINVSKIIILTFDITDSVTAFAHAIDNVSRESDNIQNPTDPVPAPNVDVTGASIIPEYQNILIPSFSLIAIFIVFKGRGRRKKSRIRK